AGRTDQPGGCVDGDQVVVLVEHTKVHRFGLQLRRNGFRDFPAEAIARPQTASRPRRSVIEADVPLRDQPLDLAAALPRDQPGQVLVESKGVDRDSVLLRLGQARRERPLRQSVPTRSTATPTVIAESATLKIGQCGTWMKSMTEPLTPRSWGLGRGPRRTARGRSRADQSPDGSRQ